MAMKAAAYCVLVTPTGDNDEGQRGQLLVVHNDKPQRTVFRGVVQHVGKSVDDDIEIGDVAHYTGFHEIPREGAGDSSDVWHVVPHGNLIAIED